MKFLHLADLHLGKRLNDFSFLEDQVRLLCQVEEIARSERADAVLIAGDVYQKASPQSEATAAFDQFITRLKEMGLAVFVISGNHDSAQRISYFSSLLKNSGVYVSEAFDGHLQQVTLQDEHGELVVSPPKTRNSVRTLALPQQAVDLLIAEHKKHPRNPYLFPSPKTGTMYDPDAFRRTHDKILKAIGAEHIRFHDLRHTFATLSLKSGVDVKTLSGALGHYSAGFTLNTYTHATAQMRQDAADTIGGVISQQMR